MSRIIFFVLGLVMLQTVCAENAVQQAVHLLTDDVYRIRRDTQGSLVKKAEDILTRARRASPTLYSQPGSEPMKMKIMSLD